MAILFQVNKQVIMNLNAVVPTPMVLSTLVTQESRKLQKYPQTNTGRL